MQLSDFDTCANLIDLFLARADERGDVPFLWAKQDGAWESQSWSQVAARVCLLAQSLVRLGFAPGDRILLVSENRPEWLIADMAIMAAGCVTVPAYTTNTERDHTHVLENSGARGVIVSNAKLAKPLLPAVIRSGVAAHVIGIEPLGMAQAGAVEYHDWDDLLTGDPVAARAAVDARRAGIGRGDTACIIYTSGTGGAPRGVMQHHGALLHNVGGAAHVVVEDFGWGEEVFLSFLPLSHAYEHTAGQFLPIGMGAQIYYAEGLDKLAGNIEDTRPTIMVVVPRLFEVLRSRIIKQIEKQGGAAVWMMEQAIALEGRRMAGGLRLLDYPLDLLLEKLLRPKIRARFGGRVKALVSGGAPLTPDVGLFFQAMGLTLLQGYGQTECAPIACVNRPSAGVRMETVGPPMRHVDLKIAEDGEILIAGELVMHGYWRNEAETAKVLIPDAGGRVWLYTGDIGHLDAVGRLLITDRKKDMIVNDKGDNISPQKVEGMLTLQPEIAQAMVMGDRRPYVVGLIVPDAEWMRDWARAQGVSGEWADLCALPAFRAAVRAAVDRVNVDLSVIEKVRQFAFADEAFSIDNAEMTPSLKIRRHKLKERYGERLDALYRG
ncbi:AMP-binding protein [Novosphingobium sp. FSY-8]|uniref:AMP-binding protein n=1 Tax=Novosphingobium ovatum TaxID=1908523 RepID=A0ABW9XEN0_9SPHN|nr:long-chain fatty acid--CoA ligase [Novosphingobium ovatum]NBC37014.1 AMP-binding protein [Novosphingobium ovatum]